MRAQVTKYKGRSILTIPTGERYHFSFGQKKAKLILDYIDDIYKFAGVTQAKSKTAHNRLVKSSGKPSWLSGHCWYCNNGDDRQVLNEGLSLYYLCECGATDCPLPNHRVTRNKLGGVKSISWHRG